MHRHRFLASVLLALLLLGLFSAALTQDVDKPLACILFSNSFSSSSQELSRNINAGLESRGYRVDTLFCDGDISMQIRQIQNAVVCGADVMVVECAGESHVYSALFSQIVDAGIKLLVLGCSDETIDCSLQITNHRILEGLRTAELVTRFLDDNYPDAPPKSIKLLLLAMSSKSDYVRAYAGHLLIGEKFVRYFDVDSLEYIHNASDAVVFYTDRFGCKQIVDEATGGLILNENGEAMLNPYYDPRVDITTYANMNVATNLDGQQAIDISILQNPNLCVVVAMNGDAAIGAAERLNYYHELGMLNIEKDKLAVFGEGNTAQNRESVLASHNSGGVLRGFVGLNDLQWQSDSLVSMLLHKAPDTPKLLIYGGSYRSLIDPAGTTVGIVSVRDSFFPDPNIIFASPDE